MSDGPYAGLAVQRRGMAGRRWRMACVHEPAPPAPEPEAAAPAEPEPDPAQVREEARAQGYAHGLAQGREQGLKEGREAGRGEGEAVGREEGYRQGHEAGLAEGREQARREALYLHELAQHCAASLAELEENVGQALITLALDIARQVVRTTLAQQPEAIAAAVREVLQVDTSDGARLKLWVHPEDMELVRLHLADELAEGRWRIMADPALARGGCRAETAYGTIDATLQTRWRRVAASLGRDDEWEAQS